MHHLVKDWMSSPVTIIDPDSSVTYALTLMRRRRIHSLVVVIEEPTQLKYGILTTTDVRDKIIAEDRNPAETRVRDIMTVPVTTAKPDWTLKMCSVEMQARRIHHMPVIDDTGEMVGIISATDLFIAAEEIGWGAGN